MAMNSWKKLYAIRPLQYSNDHAPHPSDQRAPLRANPRLLACLGISQRSRILFCGIGCKMQEMSNKMPSASVYMVEKIKYFAKKVADSLPGSIIIYRKR